MIDLPIEHYKHQIVEKLKNNQIILISSPPGSGKSTRVPIFAFEAGLGPVVMLQPRRAAARKISGFLKKQLSDTSLVGHHIKNERTISKETQISVLTEGVLARKLSNNKNDEYKTYILDEFHERNLHSDFCISCLLPLLEEDKSKRLIIMSATINIEELQAFIPSLEVIEIKLKPFPLEIAYHKRTFRTHENIDLISDIRDTVFLKYNNSEFKKALVFMPGVGEINELKSQLISKGVAPDRVGVLYSSLPGTEQDFVLGNENSYEIIICTNIAETSLTIQGVDFVFDSGLERRLFFDAGAGVDQLKLERISNASAIQRSGRAARVGAGKAYRFWDEVEQKRLQENVLPDIQRVDLTETVFSLGESKSDFLSRRWPTQPAIDLVNKAYFNLEVLGLTKNDKFLQETIGVQGSLRTHLILNYAKLLGVNEEGRILAALVEEKGYFRINYEEQNDFIIDQIEEFRWQSKKNKLPSMLFRTYQQLSKVKLGSAFASPFDIPKYLSEDEKLQLLVCLSFLDRLCLKRDKNKNKGKMIGGRGVIISRDVNLEKFEYFLAIDVLNSSGKAKGEAQVSVACGISEKILKQLLSNYTIKIQTELKDKKKENLLRVADYFHDIRLSPLLPVSLSRVDKIKRDFNSLISNKTKAYKKYPDFIDFIDRLHFMNKHCSEIGLNLKFLEDSFLPKEFDEAFTLFLEEEDNIELSSEVLFSTVELFIDSNILDCIDREAPKFIKLPYGRPKPIQYPRDLTPFVEVPLQHLMGHNLSFKLALERVNLMFCLLAPNGKICQKTDNLERFWKESYLDVRKDLRGRYPKHNWPEDPYSS